LIHVENEFVNSTILSFFSIVVLLQRRQRLTLNQKFESWHRAFESNINVSNFAKNFVAKINWSILIWFLSIQIQRIFIRSSMRKFDLFRSRILFHMSLQIFQRENVETSFVVFDQLRLKDFSFIDSRIKFLDYIFMSSLVMRRVVFVRDFVSFYEIDIMSYCMKFKKIKMTFFNFVLFKTCVTKDLFVRVESKKSLIKIIQCRVIVKFILSDENEIYQNSSIIHRMRSFFDHQRSNDRNDLSNNDFLLFFRSLLDLEEFLKDLQIDKKRNLSKSNV
jgi:hypothetical protein